MNMMIAPLSRRRLACLLLVAVGLLASAHLALGGAALAKPAKPAKGAKWNTLSGAQPLLVGHRGEKAFMPEHTLASYWQAAVENADYIEPDLTLTRDGHLVVTHNEWLGDTTDVASIGALAHLRTSKTWDSGLGTTTVRNEWFVGDMTLDQIRLLRVHQDPRYPWRPQHFDGMFGLLTFAEYLQVVLNVTAELGRPYGVIPELKSPRLHNAGRPYARYFEDRALLTMEHYGFARLTGPVNRTAHADLRLPAPVHANATRGPAAWQSFDLDAAEYLAGRSTAQVVALVETLPWVFTPRGLDRVSRFAAVLSPWKDFFAAGPEPVLRAANATWDPAEIARLGGFVAPDRLVAEAHRRGMAVSPYTFYDSHQDRAYLCPRGAFCPASREEELFRFFDLGADYLFVENIVEASLLRARYGDRLGRR
ncbi:hypothetical protein H4R18_002778 [Coemansia javaensis]|uniref:glycerophosphodiester phosphodiesterase n=1 Tax=Coemansia javaensis TaxID=2761396 RepID=A0A9W8LJI9_9FUNG|nr:hypothetical protein H4R18_002778 [Coemansia javaensis]